MRTKGNACTLTKSDSVDGEAERLFSTYSNDHISRDDTTERVARRTEKICPTFSDHLLIYEKLIKDLKEVSVEYEKKMAQLKYEYVVLEDKYDKIHKDYEVEKETHIKLMTQMRTLIKSQKKAIRVYELILVDSSKSVDKRQIDYNDSISEKRKEQNEKPYNKKLYKECKRRLRNKEGEARKPLMKHDQMQTLQLHSELKYPEKQKHMQPLVSGKKYKEDKTRNDRKRIRRSKSTTKLVKRESIGVRRKYDERNIKYGTRERSSACSATNADFDNQDTCSSFVCESCINNVVKKLEALHDKYGRVNQSSNENATLTEATPDSFHTSNRNYTDTICKKCRGFLIELQGVERQTDDAVLQEFTTDNVYYSLNRQSYTNGHQDVVRSQTLPAYFQKITTEKHASIATVDDDDNSPKSSVMYESSEEESTSVDKSISTTDTTDEVSSFPSLEDHQITETKQIDIKTSSECAHEQDSDNSRSFKRNSRYRKNNMEPTYTVIAMF